MHFSLLLKIYVTIAIIIAFTVNDIKEIYYDTKIAFPIIAYFFFICRKDLHNKSPLVEVASNALSCRFLFHHRQRCAKYDNSSPTRLNITPTEVRIPIGTHLQ
jgi:hypothetical protein